MIDKMNKRFYSLALDADKLKHFKGIAEASMKAAMTKPGMSEKDFELAEAFVALVRLAEVAWADEQAFLIRQDKRAREMVRLKAK